MTSGLLPECFKSKWSLRSAQSEALIWLNNKTEFIADGRVPMCGASVHFDRAWLKLHMPELERWFHYGNLDVSSVEKIARLWHPEIPEWRDRGLHRVEPDNEDAISELKFYLEHRVLTASLSFAGTRP